MAGQTNETNREIAEKRAGDLPVCLLTRMKSSNRHKQARNSFGVLENASNGTNIASEISALVIILNQNLVYNRESKKPNSAII